VNDNILAEMTYFYPTENLIIIDHTEVSEELKGQNTGFQLVQAAVHYPRQQGIKIIPMCPFAHSVFKKNQVSRICWKLRVNLYYQFP
jgi:predicted GNAT family acetyltransferase